MRERYGVDRRNWAGPVLAIGTVSLFVLALSWVWLGIRGNQIDSQLLAWNDSQPGRVSMTFTVKKQGNTPARCVLRAQDRSRVDVGYATVDIPAAPEQIEITYELAVLAPAFLAEVLGCSVEGPPQVAEPQFPPGVAPPAQPWTG